LLASGRDNDIILLLGKLDPGFNKLTKREKWAVCQQFTSEAFAKAADSLAPEQKVRESGHPKS